MPCFLPSESTALQCKKKLAYGTESETGQDHVWPGEGHLIIERCERYCQYCYDVDGTEHKWKFAWYLRRHVEDVHAGRTHPNLTCSQGWKLSQNGNRKPRRATGSAPPMGAKAPPAPKPPKTPPPPARKQRRATQKRAVQTRRRAAATATETPEPDTPPTTPTPSPPSLTVNTNFSTPATQRSLPPGFVYTPRSYLMAGGLGFAPDTATALSFGGAKPNNAFSDPHGTNAGTTDFFGGPLAAATTGWDSAMNGLDLASNVSLAPDTFTTALFDPIPAGPPHPTFATPQLNRTDGLTIDDGAAAVVAPTGEAVEELLVALNAAVHDAQLSGKTAGTLGDAGILFVLQHYARMFKHGVCY